MLVGKLKNPCPFPNASKPAITEKMNKMISSPPYTFPSAHWEMELLSANNSIVVYPVSEKRYQLVSKIPDWLDLLGCDLNERQFAVNQPGSFLECFLIEAKIFWYSGKKDTLLTGKWIQTDTQGFEYPFAAIATFLMAQPILFLQNMTENSLEIGQILEFAREGGIDRQKIEVLASRGGARAGLCNRSRFLLNAGEQQLIGRLKPEPMAISNM